MSDLEACWFCGNAWGSCSCAFPSHDASGDEQGFEHHQVLIHAPHLSVCTRFFVDPIETYGLAFAEWMRDRHPEVLDALPADKRDSILKLAAKPRKYLVARFDVSALSQAQIDSLALHVQAQSEASDQDYEAGSGLENYPDVDCRIEVEEAP